ncbi:hypothetical protein CMT52_14720 [Elizabethkingia anophelis]|nr:hypothetical protein [Elizabethkingia anophelis]
MKKQINFRIVELPNHQVLLMKDFSSDDEVEVNELVVVFFIEGVKLTQSIGFIEEEDRDKLFSAITDEQVQEFINNTLEMLNLQQPELELKDIKSGEIFTIGETPSYPKLRTDYGYIDMRDKIVMSCAELPHEIRIMSLHEVAEKFNVTLVEIEKWVLGCQRHVKHFYETF